MQVIANGVDPAEFPPASKRPVVLAAGRIWDEAKNLASLAAIAGELAWSVEIAGDAAHPDRGVASIAPARAIGRLDPAAMRNALTTAAIFAAPARYEPFGLAILEAASAGCALVLGDIPSLRENWEGAAVFVDPDDREGLRAALQQLIADAGMRYRLAAAARSRAGRFGLARMGERYRTLYADLIASGGRARIAVPAPNVCDPDGRTPAFAEATSNLGALR